MTNLHLKYPPLNSLIVNSEFGQRISPTDGSIKLHEGMDFKASTGTELYNSHDGTVIFSGRINGYGNVVVIQDSGRSNQATLYAHLSENYLKKNDKLSERTLIGKTGSSGTRSSHLHMEILDETRAHNLNNYNILPSGGRINLRPYLASSAFSSMFTEEVHSGDLGFGEKVGDDRDNIMIRDGIGQERPVIFNGLGGTDTYKIRSSYIDKKTGKVIQSQDQIEDLDSDSIIYIDKVRIEGETTPLKDKEGNIIPNQWTIGRTGILLSKVGDDLVISKGKSKVTYKNYDFNSPGISFGCLPDPSLGFDEQYKKLSVENIFIDSNLMFPLEDKRGRFAAVTKRFTKTPNFVSSYAYFTTAYFSIFDSLVNPIETNSLIGSGMN